MEIIGPVKCNGRFGYLIPDGNFAVEPVFEELGAYSEGLISFREGDRIGFLNNDGSVRIPLDFKKSGESMPVFKSGLAAMRSSGKAGYIDKNGRWQIAATFFFRVEFS